MLFKNTTRIELQQNLQKINLKIGNTFNFLTCYYAKTSQFVLNMQKDLIRIEFPSPFLLLLTTALELIEVTTISHKETKKL